MVILIISVIGELAEWILYDWLLQLSDYRCPTTANCPITLYDYDCKECLVKNEAANTPLIFEKFIMVIIKSELRFNQQMQLRILDKLLLSVKSI